MEPLIRQLKMLPDLNFSFVPSSSVDGSDVLLVVAIENWNWSCMSILYSLPEEHFILSHLLDARAFYLCTQSPMEGAVNKICFIPASCERLSNRNRTMPVPSHWCCFQIIPASCGRGLSQTHTLKSLKPTVHWTSVSIKKNVCFLNVPLAYFQI